MLIHLLILSFLFWDGSPVPRPPNWEGSTSPVLDVLSLVVVTVVVLGLIWLELPDRYHQAIFKLRFFFTTKTPEQN